MIATHKDYDLPAYTKEREWVRTVWMESVARELARHLMANDLVVVFWQQAKEGFKLFDAILDGMEHEEKEYLEYERESESETETLSVSSSVDSSVSSATLEERLEALRRRSAPSSQGALPVSSEKAEPLPSSGVSAAHANSQPLPFRDETAKVSLCLSCPFDSFVD